MRINRKAISGLFLGVTLVGVVWWLLPSHNQPAKLETITAAQKSAIKPAGRLEPPIAAQRPAEILPKPKIFKSKGWPPTTPEQKAMWDWWNAMYKADPKFEWKTPIQFYGKVVDQFGEPVGGATIVFNWTTVGGPTPDPQTRIESGIDGRFALSDVQGKRLSVDVMKKGYIFTKNSIGSFEYAAFFEDNFHVPDAANPVVLQLQKLTGAEPMYKYLPTGRVPLDGTPLLLNVASGKVGGGDLSFSINLGKDRGGYGPDYKLTVQGNGGAGVAPSNDEFLFSAPDSGYQSTLTLEQVATDPKYSVAQKLRFYVKTSGGKYAAVEVEIDLREKTSNAGFFAIVYYNPSGSRNLEFDQSKWLNK